LGSTQRAHRDRIGLRRELLCHELERIHQLLGRLETTALELVAAAGADIAGTPVEKSGGGDRTILKPAIAGSRRTPASL